MENVSDDFPSKRSSKISFQTSPEVRHQFRRKLRQLHSGNCWCLKNQKKLTAANPQALPRKTTKKRLFRCRFVEIYLLVSLWGNVGKIQLGALKWGLRATLCNWCTIVSAILDICGLFLTNFCAPFFKEIPSFFCGVTPSKTLAAPQPLNIGFPLGNEEF